MINIRVDIRRHRENNRTFDRLSVWIICVAYKDKELIQMSQNQIYFRNFLLHVLTLSCSVETFSSSSEWATGIHGGSRTGTLDTPMVGEGTVKSMLGGGTCKRCYHRWFWVWVMMGNKCRINICIQCSRLWMIFYLPNNFGRKWAMGGTEHSIDHTHLIIIITFVWSLTLRF